MANPDPAAARRAAAEAVQAYTEHMDLGVEAHHRTTTKFLQPEGALREQVDNFIAGVPLAQLPQLNVELGKLALIPVVERVIEARASHIRNALKGGSRKSGVRASLGLRLAEFHANFRRPEYLYIFMTCWSRARHARGIASELGLELHPEVQESAPKLLGFNRTSGL